MSSKLTHHKSAPTSIKTRAPKVAVHPLTDVELAQLDEALDHLAAGLDMLQEASVRMPLSLDAVDGLFAALAMSPSNTAIGDWMPLVMGDARFDTKEVTQSVRNLLIRHYNSVVYAIRKADIEEYQPCVSYNDDDQPLVAAWCAGFLQGFERQEEAWALRMDDGAWAEIHVFYALKESDEHGDIVIPDDVDEGEYALFERRIELTELMRSEVSQLVDEPADNLTLMLFALTGLQATLLSAKTVTPSNKGK